MLTRSGWLTLLAAATILIAGRVFGVFELFVLGVAGVGLVVVAYGYVALRRLELDVTRELSPPRVNAGSPCRIDLDIRNVGSFSTPVLAMEDPVSGTRGAKLMLAPLRDGDRARAAYRLPTERRGVVRVGPLALSAADPLGLAQIKIDAAGVSELLVYPRVDTISVLTRSAGDDPDAHLAPQSHLAPTGEDFYALRPYMLGDDLRRVHWRSSAHHDELIIRQDEMPWQGRITVLLDTRPGPSDPWFEAMVSAAASVANASYEHGDLLRLVTTAPWDSGFGLGREHLRHIMEHLATVEQSHGDLGDSIEALTRVPAGGSIVAVVGETGGGEARTLQPLGTRFGTKSVVLFRDERTTHLAADAPLASPSVIVVDSVESFPTAWDTAMQASKSAPALRGAR